MGQHYIPQYYLKGFGTSIDPSLIWVYGKGINCASLIPIKSVANEKKRWPERVERYLTNEIENPGNEVLDKIRDKQKINTNDKRALSKYMILMLHRVPRGLQKTKEAAPEVLNEVIEKSKKDIERLIKELPSKQEILQKRLDELPGIKAKFEKDFPMQIWYGNLKTDAFRQPVEVLNRMTWLFLMSENKHAFITSDNPVFYFEGIGMIKPESQVIFPICSSIALLTTWNSNYKEGYSKEKDTIIKEINKRIASGATKYVYYSKEDQGIISLINKNKWKLKKLI